MGASALMLLLLLLGGLVARGAAWSASCATDLDCSLNGVCTSGFCVCDKGWVSADHTGKGSHAGGCGLLDFKPAPSSVSFHGLDEKKSSWGGSILQLPVAPGNKTGSAAKMQYAMFAAEMCVRLRRHRPCHWPLLSVPLTPSCPSGHTIARSATGLQTLRSCLQLLRTQPVHTKRSSRSFRRGRTTQKQSSLLTARWRSSHWAMESRSTATVASMAHKSGVTSTRTPLRHPLHLTCHHHPPENTKRQRTRGS
jgi:hypothetical protein